MARLWGRDWTRAELLQRVGRIDQIAGFRASVLTDGPGRGSRVLDVDTGGGLAFRVLLDRGADIGACRIDGRPVAWISPVGDAHPTYYRPSDDGWLRTFGGGLMTTCGLDTFGAASTDGPASFGLHGSIDHVPAEEVAYRGRWDGDAFVLEVDAVVRQARVFGENIVLRRTMRTWLGSTRIDVDDEITNLAFHEQPHMVLYHCNLGFPFIDEGSTLRIDGEPPSPRDTVARDGLVAWHRGEAPQNTFAEQVFLHRLRAPNQRSAAATVANREAGLVLSLSVDASTLPFLYQWKMMGQGTYVMGLEPANCRGIEGRARTHDAGDLPVLAPQETRRYRLSFDLSHETADAHAR